MGLRCQSEPSSEVASRFEPVGVWNKGFHGGCCDRSNTRDRGQAPHVLVALRLRDNVAFELVDPLPQHLDLMGDFRQGEAGGLRQASVGLVAHDLVNAATFAGPVAAMTPNSDK
jgi:hypothetical protein